MNGPIYGNSRNHFQHCSKERGLSSILSKRVYLCSHILEIQSATPVTLSMPLGVFIMYAPVTHLGCLVISFTAFCESQLLNKSWSNRVLPVGIQLNQRNIIVAIKTSLSSAKGSRICVLNHLVVLSSSLKT